MLFKGFLLELGGPFSAPGARLHDFSEDLDWTPPTRGQVLRTAMVSQPMARTSGPPNPPWFEDESATLSLAAFSFLLKKKFAHRNPVTGEVTEWKVVEVTDEFGPLTARTQKLTSRGCVGP